MPVVKTLVVLVCLCVAAVIALFVLALRPAIAPIESPAQTFPPDLIRRGAALAALGDCITCHTAPGGRAFAGGRAVPTPFGTIYSTNITPDYGTGIGRWSEDAFRRALREGVDREGHALYPAFPYDHFTLMSDDDIHALYAYAMTRDPVGATSRPNDLSFPFNLRPLLVVWKWMFLREGPYRPDPAKSAQWNRGAYLVEGIGHCGACHTPRDTLGGEEADRRFGGGTAEGWAAYALDASAPAPVHWDAASLGFYLRNGWHEAHGVAHGPMAPVIDNLASLPEADIAAMAVYLAGIAGEPSANARLHGEALVEQARRRQPGAKPAAGDSLGGGQAAGAQSAGAQIYQAACAICHDSGRPLPFGGVDLSLSSGPSAPEPRNVVNMVLWGLPASDGRSGPIMPGFANVLSDSQIADLLAYLRARFGNKPAWSEVDKTIADARNGVTPVNVYPAPAIDPAPRPLRQSVSQHEAQP